MPDYFQTVGFQRDFAKLMSVLERIANSLDKLSTPVVTVTTEEAARTAREADPAERSARALESIAADFDSATRGDGWLNVQVR